jgi:hypothetical protein
MLTIAVRGVKPKGGELRGTAARQAIGMENAGDWRRPRPKTAYVTAIDIVPSRPRGSAPQNGGTLRTAQKRWRSLLARVMEAIRD